MKSHSCLLGPITWIWGSPGSRRALESGQVCAVAEQSLLLGNGSAGDFCLQVGWVFAGVRYKLLIAWEELGTLIQQQTGDTTLHSSISIQKHSGKKLFSHTFNGICSSFLSIEKWTSGLIKEQNKRCLLKLFNVFLMITEEAWHVCLSLKNIQISTDLKDQRKQQCFQLCWAWYVEVRSCIIIGSSSGPLSPGQSLCTDKSPVA